MSMNLAVVPRQEEEDCKKNDGEEKGEEETNN